MAWENVLDDSHHRLYAGPRHCINSWMSAVHFHALRNVFCVMSAHLGLNRSVFHSQRAEVLQFRMSSEVSSYLAQTVGLFWSTELVYIVLSGWIYAERTFQA